MTRAVAAAGSTTAGDLFLKAATALVLAYIGINLVSSARRMAASRELRNRIVWIIRGLRLRHFLLAPVVLAMVLVVAGLLIQVPGLNFGWWTFIGGQGNPVFGRTSTTSGTPLEWLVPLVFLVLLIPCLPLFAEREERSFRLGAERWSQWRRLRRSVEFGLVHAIIGIPIGVALALSLGGVYFTWAYLRGYRKATRTATVNPDPYGAIGAEAGDEALPWSSPPVPSAREQALAESTRTHLGYNLTIVILVVPALLLSGLVK
jgi:hypothetical protein